MIFFATQSVRYLISPLSLHHGKSMVKKFSDGELFVRIDEDIHTIPVWVVASTIPPAENILELLFMLNALKRAGASSINLIVAYLAYARQAIVAPGESCSACVLADALKNAQLAKLYIIHAHNADALQKLIPFNQVIPTTFFCEKSAFYDAIAAPDKGAHSFAQQIAQICNKPLVRLTKIRPEHEQVKIESVDGDVAGKRILLVDDVISTGRTLMNAARALVDKGALEVAAAATHGILAGEARLHIDESILEKVYITNTIDQTSAGKIEVTDIAPLINDIIQLH